MRRLTPVAFGLLLASALTPLSAGASNVLLPSGSSGASLPSLGLSAPSSSTSTDSSSTDASKGIAPAAQTPAPTPTATATATDTTAAKSATGAATIDDGTIVTPPNSASVKGLPFGSVPTQIIRNPDLSAMVDAMNANKPYAITIGFSNKSFFSASDVQQIAAKVGLSRDKVSSSCTLSLRGLLQTNKGSAIIEAAGAPTVVVRYDGAIQQYLMTAQAVCIANPAALPPASGYITQLGNRFLVPLQQVSCPAPTRQVSSLTITYTGGENTGCAYQ